MRVAALDLGSNTFLCLIADGELDVNGRPSLRKILSDEVRMVRLGQDVDKTRRFHPEALHRAEVALSEFHQTILRYKPDRILAMATSAARDVENGEALFELGRKFQIPIEIVPGAQEAQMTYAGATSGLSGEATPAPANLVIDIGGGSTEFIRGTGTDLDWGHSLDLGCVRLVERLGIRGAESPSFNAATQERARALIRTQLETLPEKLKIDRADARFKIDRVLAVAGTPTELARMEIGVFDPSRIDGYEFTLSKIEDWIRRLAPLSAHEIHTQFRVSQGRADVLPMGLLILSESLKYFGQARLQVSTRGVRFGVAFVALTRG